MKEHRHPHPHVDPRQPRHESRLGTNPPVFVWKPLDGEDTYYLKVSRDADLREAYLDVPSMRETVYLPETAFEPGRYFWKWSAGEAESEVFTFDIAPDTVTLEVPPAREWLARFPSEHPRIYIRPEDVAALRESRRGERAELWAEVQREADSVLAEPHEIAEPPFLPDRGRDYESWYRIWSRVMRESRRFVQGAETLALAYLASGEKQYARAACRRMASISRWDADGSSHISHNDEAHMSVIWHGPSTCDWVWDEFTEEERKTVVAQFRRRGEITCEHMHGDRSYGVTRFDSHAGREIVFLAQIAFVFHEHIPEAGAWLKWLRPVLCGIWPIWAGDDGAWAEGPSYGLAYVQIMTMFATTLKRGANIDLYRRPFWRGHAQWRLYCLPPYAEWMGFGDQTQRSAGSWRANADLVERIAQETGSDEFSAYVKAFREEADRIPRRSGGRSRQISALRYLAPRHSPEPRALTRDHVHRVFPAAGWAAIRTDLEDPSRDIALIFRSSPFGAVSHSHANNNDFIIHVAGRAMAMPSGYYSGYGSDHHAHWVWHTKSHNCVTLSDAPQIMRSHDSRGSIENAFEDARLVYLCGNADASYRDRAARCRRHVVFLKAANSFVMIDEFVTAPGMASALQWNIHSWNPFAVDEARRTFLLEREGSTLEGHFMYHHNAFFSLSEGWDPPPFASAPERAAQWRQQYHLRFTTSGLAARRNLGVVLCPGHAALARAGVSASRSGNAEMAHVGDDIVLVNQTESGPIEHDDLRSESLALLIVQGEPYEVGPWGIRRSYR